MKGEGASLDTQGVSEIGTLQIDGSTDLTGGLTVKTLLSVSGGADLDLLAGSALTVEEGALTIGTAGSFDATGIRGELIIDSVTSDGTFIAPSGYAVKVTNALQNQDDGKLYASAGTLNADSFKNEGEVYGDGAAVTVTNAFENLLQGEFYAGTGTLSVGGDFQNSATFYAGTGTLTVTGSGFTNTGTFESEAGTVNFAGSGTQSYEGGSAVLNNFNVSSETEGANLTLDASFGLLLGGQGSVLSSPDQDSALAVGTELRFVGDRSATPTLICSQPVILTNGSLILDGGAIPGAITGDSTFTFKGATFTQATGTISVAEFVYDTTGATTVQKAGAREYAGSLRFTGGKTAYLDGARLEVTGDVTIDGSTKLRRYAPTGEGATDGDSVDGDLDLQSGTLYARDFPKIILGGDLKGTTGYKLDDSAVASATLVLAGSGAQTLHPMTYDHLEIAGGTTAFAGDEVLVHKSVYVSGGLFEPEVVTLSLEADLNVGSGGRYSAERESDQFTRLVFMGTQSQGLSDDSRVQSFGNVTIGKDGVAGTDVWLGAAVTVESLEVASGTLTAGQELTVRGDWKVEALASFDAGNGTVIFAGDTNATVWTRSTGSDDGVHNFRNLRIEKEEATATVTVKDHGLYLAGDLAVDSGWLILDDVDLKVTSDTDVEAGARLELQVMETTANRAHTFVGPLTLGQGTAVEDRGGRFLFGQDSGHDTVVTFQDGFVAKPYSSFVATQATNTGTGAVAFRFGVNSNSRVGGTSPVDGYGDDGTELRIVGPEVSPRIFTLDRHSGTLVDQWFFALNRATDTHSGTLSVAGVSVKNSDANAGNVVKAKSSINAGNNENWSFEGKHNVKGVVRSQDGTPKTGRAIGVKLVRVSKGGTGEPDEDMTVLTDRSTGAFSFELSEASNEDRIAVFIDNDPDASGAAITVIEPGAGDLGLSGLDVVAGKLLLRAHTATATVTADVLSAIGHVDHKSDRDIPLTVDAEGNASVSDVELVVTEGVTVTLSRDLSAPDGVTIEAGAALELADSKTYKLGDTVVYGKLRGVSTGADVAPDQAIVTIVGSLTVQGGGMVLAPTSGVLSTSQNLTIVDNGVYTGGSGTGARTAVGGTLVIGGATGTLTTGSEVTVEGTVSALAGRLVVSDSGELNLGNTVSGFTGELAIGASAAVEIESDLGSLAGAATGTVTVGSNAETSIAGMLRVDSLACQASSTLAVTGSFVPRALFVAGHAALSLSGATATIPPLSANPSTWTVTLDGIRNQTVILGTLDAHNQAVD
ncbi:hypothetical protein ACFL59_13210, partial [Planctomycetota bacterium]